MPLLCSYCHKEITEAPIAAIHLGCAPKVKELVKPTTNNAMLEIADRLDVIAVDIANADINGFGNQVAEVADRVRQLRQ